MSSTNSLPSPGRRQSSPAVVGYQKVQRGGRAVINTAIHVNTQSPDALQHSLESPAPHCMEVIQSAFISGAARETSNAFSSGGGNREEKKGMFKFMFAQDLCVRGVLGNAGKRRGHLDVSISINLLNLLRTSFISCVSCSRVVHYDAQSYAVNRRHRD